MSIEQFLMQFADEKHRSVSYNTAMRGKSDVLRLVRIACVLWLAYLVVSAAIDYGLKSPGDIEKFLYIANGGIALFLFGLTFWSSLSQKIGKVFSPARSDVNPHNAISVDSSFTRRLAVQMASNFSI